jgi:ubiquinone/menaquinone biosynthesis C-methylase UbiE
VVATACELRLFDHLSTRPMTAAELAGEAGAAAVPTRALLEVCLGLGLVRLEQGRFANQPVAEVHLVAGRPTYLGHLVHLFSAEAPQWQGLGELVRTGAPPPEGPGGEVASDRFTLAMHTLGLLGEADALAAAAPLGDCRLLVDVGGGSGVYSVALCRRFPGLHSNLLDRREVLETTAKVVGGSGVEDRISLTPADITQDPYGDDADAVLLSDVLYLDEEACLRMLESARRALVPGGRLVVRGYFSDPDRSHPRWGSLFDLARLLWDAGREPITHARLRGWLERTGFSEVELFPLTERSTCALARRS